MKTTAKSTAACPFCSGKGYFQLLLAAPKHVPPAREAAKRDDDFSRR